MGNLVGFQTLERVNCPPFSPPPPPLHTHFRALLSFTDLCSSLSVFYPFIIIFTYQQNDEVGNCSLISKKAYI